MRKILILSLLTWAAWSVISPATSYAYIDPGTGSYVFQLIIAGILSALVSIKIYWRQVRGFLLRLTGKEKRSRDSENN